MADNPHQKDNAPILGDEIAQYNGATTTSDVSGLKPVLQVVALAVRASDGAATDVNLTAGLPVEAAGTYAYRAGTGPVTITVPGGARLRAVSVLPGTSGATLTINGGNTITIPADTDFDREIPGRCVGPTVVIAGDVTSYYVDWVA